MTTQEIYKFANETKEQELNNIIARFDAEETELFNVLVKLGDEKGVAVFTVIAEKMNKKEDSKMYYNAYNL
jgi:hypothetical protein